ncbi:hypothetical protein CBM2599_B50282 [Cupriavidus taiwanensis]|uniref:Uncharacterized protein n=1 Tax=Cupriavidus taiwanensis TaxID=164546 RepID=A0A9Q7XWX5_9BURK|nr:hypothetical protein CBM2599_B50282 [Cupriavidus taiwanensis]SPD68972.1 protein of unknown function [Cupriavidus taiwanensis]
MRGVSGAAENLPRSFNTPARRMRILNPSTCERREPCPHPLAIPAHQPAAASARALTWSARSRKSTDTGNRASSRK